jgi:hypothetical protein
VSARDSAREHDDPVIVVDESFIPDNDDHEVVQPNIPLTTAAPALSTSSSVSSLFAVDRNNSITESDIDELLRATASPLPFQIQPTQPVSPIVNPPVAVHAPEPQRVATSDMISSLEQV